MPYQDITEKFLLPESVDLFGRRFLINPKNGHFRMGVPNGVQVVGFTPDMKIVAITEEKDDGSIYTHLPSGMTDLTERSIEQTAADEFAEETGYSFKKLILLSLAEQAPAHVIGFDAIYVALGCVLDINRTRQPDLTEKILKVEELTPAELERRMYAYLTADSPPYKKGRNSFASLRMAMIWAEKQGLFNKPVTDASPRLIVLAGLPTTGKTTLGDLLEQRLNIHFADIDRVKKVLYGLPTRAEYQWRQANPEAGDAKSAAEMRRAYTSLHDGLNVALDDGLNTIVAATYSKKGSQEFLSAIAKRHGARVKVVLLTLRDDSEEVINQRIRRDAKSTEIHGCASYEHYLRDKARYQAVTTTGVFPPESILEIDSSQPVDAYIDRVIEFVQK